MKKPAYDNYYQEENYFGAPCPGLVEFFTLHEPKGFVLDLGCGQGRDALFLGELRYRVIGVDISSVGVRQMETAARSQGFDVTGVVGDAYTYPIGDADIVLLDAMLHFYSRDMKKETALVLKILNELKTGGILVSCMISGRAREAHIKQIVRKADSDWDVLFDGYTEYHEANADYHMYVVQKKDVKG